MEINITSFFGNCDPFEFSASRAERGANAGAETWRNAVKEGADCPLLKTEEELQALRDHMRGFGAWDNDEIAAWSAAECNALLLQMISGDMREAGLDTDEPDWEAYESDENESNPVPAFGIFAFPRGKMRRQRSHATSWRKQKSPSHGTRNAPAP